MFSDLSVSFLSVFKEKPKHPPSRAQSLSYSLVPETSYLNPIIRLFKNLNFKLLIITYGKMQMCPGVYLSWECEARGLMCLCIWLFPDPKCACKVIVEGQPEQSALSQGLCGFCKVHLENCSFLCQVIWQMPADLPSLISVSLLSSSIRWSFLSCCAVPFPGLSSH